MSEATGGAEGGGEADVSPGVEGAPGGQPTPAEARRLRLLIDGKEQEFDESHVRANFQKGLNASKLLSKVEQRRQEALAAMAKAEGLMGRATKDPLGFLKELGIDTRRMSEEQILAEIRLEQMTPEQRRMHEMEQRLKGHEDEKKKAEEEQKKTAYTREVEEQKNALASLFLETMERTKLPRSSGRFVISRMASLYAENEKAGLESTPDEMAEHVLAGLKAEQQGVLGGLEGEALLSYLGPEVLKRVLQANLVRAQPPRRPSGPTQQQPSVPRSPAKTPLARGGSDFFRRLREGEYP